MAKKATYQGPWDRHEFPAGEMHEDAQGYDRGVPVKVSNELAARLEASPENFLIEDYDEAEDGKVGFNEPLFVGEEDQVMTDATANVETPQTGDSVATESTTTTGTSTSGSTGTGTVAGSTSKSGSGRASSTRSSR